MRLAAQLYTLREFTKTETGFQDALKRCREIGYDGVQLSAVGCMNGDDATVTAARAREMLDENGLLCCATHRPFENLVNQTDAEIEFHETLGCDYCAVGGAWGTNDTADGYRQWLREAVPMILRLKTAGIRFGYHNHSHEFIRDPESSLTMIDLLYKEGPADLMFEIDTYWVVNAGIDLVPFLHRYSGRLAVIHAKDMEVVSKVGPVMAPVGEGNLNWEAILPALKEGGCEWVVVEQDDYRRDPFDCLRSSYEFLSHRLGGTVR